jgi:hypothetical protein
VGDEAVALGRELDRVLPPEATTDEAFEDEPDELDEP